VTIDHSQVTVLATKLGSMPVALRARLRPTVKAAAASVAAQAKVNAAFSTRIPGAISVRSSRGTDVSGATATIRVSAAKAPHARVLEEGNTNATSTTTFRHPVYGHDTWVPQDMHPFLKPALDSKRAAIFTEIIAAIETLQAEL
jgi:hypothetical protein